MIRKESDGLHVFSESGKHMGGPYKTEAEAHERLRQIEAAKAATGYHKDGPPGMKSSHKMR